MRGGCSDQGEILTRFSSPAPEDVVRLYDDPVLRRVAREVTAFDENLRRLGDRLLAIQTRMRAVGVAAVQIAVAQSVFSVNEALVRRRGRSEVLVNPVVINTEGEIIEEEGCLCFPGIYVEVARPRRVALRACDLQGHPIEREAEGMLARAYMHEIDHLQGRLFIDRVDPETRQRVVAQIKALHAPRP